MAVRISESDISAVETKIHNSENPSTELMLSCEEYYQKLTNPKTTGNNNPSSHESGCAESSTQTSMTTQNRQEFNNINNAKCSRVDDMKSVSKMKCEEDLLCSDCNLVFTSEASANQHFKGKKHLAVKSAKLTECKDSTPVDKTHFCQTCDIALNSEGQIKQHCNGIRHRINAGIVTEAPAEWWVEQQTAFTQSSIHGNSSGKGIGETYRCDVCEKELNSDLQYKQHMESSKHKSREQAKSRKTTVGVGAMQQAPFLPKTRGRYWRGIGNRHERRGGRCHLYNRRGGFNDAYNVRNWGQMRGGNNFGGYSVTRNMYLKRCSRYVGKAFRGGNQYM